MKRHVTQHTATAVVVGIIGLATLGWIYVAQPRAAPIAAAITSIGIEPFECDSVPPCRQMEFVDSLAQRFAKVAGLRASVLTEETLDPEFRLKGSVRSKDARVVIAVQLVRKSEGLPVWSSTYWRTSTDITTLVEDVATGVAEAMYGEIARRAITRGKEGS